MGSVRKVRHRSGSVTWQARWRDPTGAQRAKNFDRKVDADRHLTDVEANKLHGRYVNPALGRTRLKDWLADWNATRTHLAPQTRLRDDASIRNHLIPALGEVPIGQLTPIAIARWVAQLDGSGLAPATTRKAYQLLAAALGSAVDNGMLHPKVIQQRLGHASIKTTLDTYGHLFDGLDEAAARRLDATRGAAHVDAM